VVFRGYSPVLSDLIAYIAEKKKASICGLQEQNIDWLYHTSHNLDEKTWIAKASSGLSWHLNVGNIKHIGIDYSTDFKKSVEFVDNNLAALSTLKITDMVKSSKELEQQIQDMYTEKATEFCVVNIAETFSELASLSGGF